MQDGEGRITQDGPEPLLELAGGGIAPQLDHETTGRRIASLRLQLAGDEPDGHDAVFLRRVQQALAGALPSGVVLEVDLAEPGQRIADVGLVVNGQASTAARVDVRKRPVRKARSLFAPEASHASTIARLPGRRERPDSRPCGPGSGMGLWAY